MIKGFHPLESMLRMEYGPYIYQRLLAGELLWKDYEKREITTDVYHDKDKMGSC